MTTPALQLKSNTYIMFTKKNMKRMKRKFTSPLLPYWHWLNGLAQEDMAQLGFYYTRSAVTIVHFKQIITKPCALQLWDQFDTRWNLNPFSSYYLRTCTFTPVKLFHSFWGIDKFQFFSIYLTLFVCRFILAEIEMSLIKPFILFESLK